MKEKETVSQKETKKAEPIVEEVKKVEEPKKILNLWQSQGFTAEKRSGKFEIFFPNPASMEDCLEFVKECHEALVEQVRIEEERVKRLAEEAKKPTEEVNPEIVNK